MATNGPSSKFFWDEFVCPDYRDFSQDQGNLRKAMHSALSAYHVYDWVWIYYETKDPGKVLNAKTQRDFVNLLIAQCPDLNILQDVVNLHKHFEFRRGNQHVITTHEARVESFPGEPLGSLTLGSSSLGGDVIVITLDDGSERNFFVVVRSVIEMWRRLDKRLQLF